MRRNLFGESHVHKLNTAVIQVAQTFDAAKQSQDNFRDAIESAFKWLEEKGMTCEQTLVRPAKMCQPVREFFRRCYDTYERDKHSMTEEEVHYCSSRHLQDVIIMNLILVTITPGRSVTIVLVNGFTAFTVTVSLYCRMQSVVFFQKKPSRRCYSTSGIKLVLGSLTRFVWGWAYNSMCTPQLISKTSWQMHGPLSKRHFKLAANL